ncbi:hypothetical protein GCM10010381_03400 [Streptomyces xantholiticus]|nr:hypothetical protein [Streptomyces xantholiticus]GGW23913.1 hypothetical protein GCM10010381_03400 [Streptomyces xantholiticus]
MVATPSESSAWPPLHVRADGHVHGARDAGGVPERGGAVQLVAVRRAQAQATPALVVAMAGAPASAMIRALAVSQALGGTRGRPMAWRAWKRRARSPRFVSLALDQGGAPTGRQVSVISTGRRAGRLRRELR